MPQDKDHKRAEKGRDEALEHPIRRRILELFTDEPERSLNARALLPDLDGLEDFDRLSISQVAYHVGRLREAKLLPGRA